MLTQKQMPADLTLYALGKLLTRRALHTQVELNTVGNEEGMITGRFR
jgi:hypothetical protein